MGLGGWAFLPVPVSADYLPLPASRRNCRWMIRLHIYFNFNAIQGVPDPLTPLGIDALRLLFGGWSVPLGSSAHPSRYSPSRRPVVPGFWRSSRRPGLAANWSLTFWNHRARRADILLRLIQDERIPPRRLLTPRLAFQMIGYVRALLRSTLVGLIQYRTARERVIREGEAMSSRSKRLAEFPGTAKGDLDACLRSWK